MIDERKLIEDIKNNIHIVSTRSNGKTIFADFLKKFIENIIKIIEEQPKISLENKTSDWIPVEEALPKEDGNYLVSGVWGSGKKTVGDCEFSVSDGYFDVCWNFNVLAWQPLPKAYEVQDET